jgi:hypothetical protein
VRRRSRRVSAGQQRSGRVGLTFCLVSQKILSIYKDHALAGRADLREASHKNRCGWVGRAGCGIPSTSLRATTRQPEGRAKRHTRRFPSRAAPGLTYGRAAPDRRDATQSQRARSISGPSPGRRTSRSIEKPEEVARAFLLVNSAALLRWRRWRSARRTSWPVSRILLVVDFPSSHQTWMPSADQAISRRPLA